MSFHDWLQWIAAGFLIATALEEIIRRAIRAERQPPQT